MLTHIASRLYNTPLLVDPRYHEVVCSALADRLGVAPTVSQATIDSYRRPTRRPEFDRASGIAILPIVGGMVHRVNDMEAASGIQSYVDIQNKLFAFADDPRVRGILLDLDTPGGEVAGIHETAQVIEDIAKEKPIWALANARACSAGMWVAAAADRVYVVPGGDVGSIGVLVMHQDVSRLMDKRGVTTTIIHAGKNKVDGHPYAPLPDEVRENIQAGVDALWDEFASYVAKRRGLSTSTVKGFEAAVFGPQAAKQNGLVDDVATFGATLQAFRTFLG